MEKHRLPIDGTAIRQHRKRYCHAEIEYGDVHSDICPPQCDPGNMNDDWQQFIMDCLKEWLEESPKHGGTSQFYIRVDYE